jgi:hypothetical protein
MQAEEDIEKVEEQVAGAEARIDIATWKLIRCRPIRFSAGFI